MGLVHIVRLREPYVEWDEDRNWTAPKFVRAFRTSEAVGAYIEKVTLGEAAPPSAINPLGGCCRTQHRYGHGYLVPPPDAPRPVNPPREWPALAFFSGRISELTSLGQPGFLVLLDELGLPCPTVDDDERGVPWHTWWREHVADAPASIRAELWKALDRALFLEVVPVVLET